MMILGPLVAPSTSTVTPAPSRPVAVTVSPSTVITTGSVSVSPTAASVLSISMTSPTATFCCLLPARTIAYTAVSFIGTELWVCRPGIVDPRAGRGRAAEQKGTPERTEGPCYAVRVVRRKTTAGRTDGCPGRQPSASLSTSHPWTVDRRRSRSPGGPVMTTPTSRLLGAAAGLTLAVGSAVAGLPAQAAGLPGCTSSDLTASYRHSDDGAGHHF